MAEEKLAADPAQTKNEPIEHEAPPSTGGRIAAPPATLPGPGRPDLTAPDPNPGPDPEPQPEPAPAPPQPEPEPEPEPTTTRRRTSS